MLTTNVTLDKVFASLISVDPLHLPIFAFLAFFCGNSSIPSFRISVSQKPPKPPFPAFPFGGLRALSLSKRLLSSSHKMPTLRVFVSPDPELVEG
jgi:hypothetical protein